MIYEFADNKNKSFKVQKYASIIKKQINKKLLEQVENI